MSELANLIKEVRGKDTQRDMARKCQFSLATIGKLEAMGRAAHATNVQLATVRKISKVYRLPEAKHLELIRAWIRLQLGHEAAKLDINFQTATLKEAPPSIPFQLCHMLVDFPPTEQKAILEACKSPDLRKAVVALVNYGGKR